MTREVCPTCMRPWKQLSPEQRARSSHRGNEHAAAGMMAMEDLNRACQVVLGELMRASWDGDQWVSARQLRDVLDGGDGPRRARQLRDEYGWPIEAEMRSSPRQAWYRLAIPLGVRPEPATLFD